LIDVQREIGDLPHKLLIALRRRREIYRLNLREYRAAQEKGATVNRPHPVRARKSAHPPAATNCLDREDFEFTHLRTDTRN
jgi:hypothetical protein